MNRVSIIVPIYNVERYLSRCVESILDQSYKNIEVILVDDGSTDACSVICDDFSNIDHRVKVIHKINGGLSDARNAGLAIAAGDYVIFIDSDDWVSPYYVEMLVYVAEKELADVVECDVIKSDGSLPLPEPLENPKVVTYTAEEALNLLIQDHEIHQYVWNKIYKKDIVEKITFEVGKCNEDEFWTYQIFGKAKKICKICVPLYYYYQRQGSIMSSGYSLKRLDAIEAKMQRQRYIEDYFPILKNLAKANLASSIIYSGQMSLLFLNYEDRKKAIKILKDNYRKVNLTIDCMCTLDTKQKVWFIMAKISLIMTCVLRNKLKRGL